MNDLAIDIHDLTKVFDDKIVVDHISLQVQRGAIYGFLGSNGSGKTTTIRMISGLITPTSGTGICLGYDIKMQREAIKTRIGYMPQKFSLYTGLTVYENLRFYADIYQLAQPKKAIKNMLDDLELNPYQHIKTGNLSGGWKQRLSLACCLIHQPELLFLDEPTAGIDPKARKDFWSYLHKIAMRDGTTILVTTHYMDEAEKCTDLAYINLGKLLYAGKTSDIVPFSNVHSYIVVTDREHMSQLSNVIGESYPDMLATVVNNDLRISSRHPASLNKFIQSQPAFQFQTTTPSFEEVFIGLMQP